MLGQQIIDGQIQPLTRIDRGVPRDLETIIQKATAREADDRYMTATDMADDLRRFLELRPIKARRASRVHHLWRWSRRNRAVAIVSSLLLTLLLVLAIAGPWVAVQQSKLAEAQKRKLYAADMIKAHDHAQRNELEQTAEILRFYRESDYRNFEWHYMARLCERRLLAFESKAIVPF